MRGQSEERRRETFSDTHPLEMIIFFAVFVDFFVFIAWFLFFARIPATPVGLGLRLTQSLDRLQPRQAGP